jgi:hypothetical protein
MACALLPLLFLAAAPPPPPTEVAVPAALRAVTRNPEFSGIAWSPTMKRYLVVTDDAGFRTTKSNHAPMVVALGEDGALDDAPVPIQGVKKLNDPESICPGPGGTYFLATSHSLNKQDESHKSRRQLLHLAVNQRSLRVLGSLDLSASAEGKPLLATAGLPPDGRLDIEAIAYHDRALYIGLKSPLTPEGRAAVLRLANPEKHLKKGRYPAKALSRFATYPLCVDVKGQKVCEGIADLLFLRDGSLAVAANAPKGGPKDGGGSLWRIPAPLPTGTPELLYRFPGLKPEGVAYTPDQRSLIIVFDTDQDPPRFTRVPGPGREGPR